MKLDLKNKEWKEFEIECLFDIKIGKNVDGNKVNKENGNIAYVTRKESNNGLDGFIDFDETLKNNDKPVITIGNETAQPFVQNFSFFTGTKVNILIPKKTLTKFTLLFICQSLQMHKSKYSYSFTINSTRLKKQKILLPINNHGKPDYAFMEALMKQKEQEKIGQFENYISQRLEDLKDFKSVEPIEKKEWKEFKLQDIFKTIKGDQNKMSALLKGNIPLISAKNGNNGLKDFVSKNTKKIYPKNSLSLNNDGDGGAGFSYYQPFDYLLDSHVTSLYPKNNLSKYSMLFISKCITKQRNRFGHGYAITNNRLTAFKIMLPINLQHEPDYDYMENYMKQLEYKKLKQYLALKKSHK